MGEARHRGRADADEPRCGLSGPDGPIGDFDGQGDVGAPKIAGSGRLQRRVAGGTASPPAARTCGATRRVPLRLEAHDRRFHPAGPRAVPRQGRRSASQGRLDGAPSLDADAPYVDGVVHGDGLTSLQFRRTGRDHRADGVPGRRAPTSSSSNEGRHLIFSAARYGETFTTAEIADVDLGDEVYVGLAFARTTRTSPSGRSSATCGSSFPRRTTSCPTAISSAACSRSWSRRAVTARSSTVRTSRFEAPNWTTDGSALIYNRSGRAEGWGGLYRFDLATRQSDADRHRRRQPQQQRSRPLVRRHDARHQRSEPGVRRPLDRLHRAGSAAARRSGSRRCRRPTCTAGRRTAGT